MPMILEFGNYSKRPRIAESPRERFIVHFDQRDRCGHPIGFRQGYKIIASHHTYDVQPGERWEVEEIIRWESGQAKSYENNRSDLIGWGKIIYVRPISNLS